MFLKIILKLYLDNSKSITSLVTIYALNKSVFLISAFPQPLPDGSSNRGSNIEPDDVYVYL